MAGLVGDCARAPGGGRFWVFVKLGFGARQRERKPACRGPLPNKKG